MPMSKFVAPSDAAKSKKKASASKKAPAGGVKTIGGDDGAGKGSAAPAGAGVDTGIGLLAPGTSSQALVLDGGSSSVDDMKHADDGNAVPPGREDVVSVRSFDARSTTSGVSTVTGISRAQSEMRAPSTVGGIPVVRMASDGSGQPAPRMNRIGGLGIPLKARKKDEVTYFEAKLLLAELQQQDVRNFEDQQKEYRLRKRKHSADAAPELPPVPPAESPLGVQKVEQLLDRLELDTSDIPPRAEPRDRYHRLLAVLRPALLQLVQRKEAEDKDSIVMRQYER